MVVKFVKSTPEYPAGLKFKKKPKVRDVTKIIVEFVKSTSENRMLHTMKK